MHTDTSKIFSNSGIAVISLLLSSTFTSPSTSPLSRAHALTICTAPFPFLRSWLRLDCFPSIATTSCFVFAYTDPIHPRKHSRNSPGSIRANTRAIVSCDGMPLGSSRNPLNHSSFDLPKSSISSHVSAPQIIAQIPITSMSISLCRLVRSIRGSLIELRYSTNVWGVDSSTLQPHSTWVLSSPAFLGLPQSHILLHLRCVCPAFFPLFSPFS